MTTKVVGIRPQAGTGNKAETLFEQLPDGWRLIRLLDRAAFEKTCAAIQCDHLVNDARIAKIADPNYLFLSLRDPNGSDSSLLVVRLEDKWIEDFCFSCNADGAHVLRAVAPVVTRNGWRKLYRWRDGYVIASDGKVSSVTALPDTLIVDGDIEINQQTEVSLPTTMVVFGTATFHTSSFKYMPRYLTALNVKVTGCTMERIAERLKTEGDLVISMSNIHQIARSAVIRGDLELSHIDRPVEMPAALRVGNNLTATSDIVKSFGADTVILGDLKISTSDELIDFGLDFTGRVLHNGDPIKIVDIPFEDLDGDRIEIEDLDNAKGTFLGRLPDGTYGCNLLDDANSRQHLIAPLRRSIAASV
ncbi:hypothetical protein GOB57_22045 [Sinorhizobium meliloti]|nr:hypothetical protein [Sinorhizobium meliloti]